MARRALAQARTQRGCQRRDQGLPLGAVDEAWAETYRLLNHGAPSWPIIDSSWIPDRRALALVRADVTRPWDGGFEYSHRGRLRAGRHQERLYRVRLPEDGTLDVSAQSSRRLDADLYLYDSRHHVLMRSATNAHREHLRYTS